MSAPAGDDDGVPLAHYRQHEGCSVRFHCEGCAYVFDAALEAVIAKLQRQGLGGPETGIRTVARLSRRPCLRCGGASWETRPGFPAGRPNYGG